MSSSSIPSEFTEYDWLELLGFAWKIDSEGYEYAAENYSPSFEAPDLQVIADDPDPRPLRALHEQHLTALTDWQEQVGYEEVGRLWDAHLREEKERKEAHLLWAVHPGGDWNYAAYSDAFESREAADKWIEGRAELVEKYGWKPWTGHMLHRDQAGGEWTRVPDNS